jgi:hypothetical protein
MVNNESEGVKLEHDDIREKSVVSTNQNSEATTTEATTTEATTTEATTTEATTTTTLFANCSTGWTQSTFARQYCLFRL